MVNSNFGNKFEINSGREKAFQIVIIIVLFLLTSVNTLITSFTVSLLMWPTNSGTILKYMFTWPFLFPVQVRRKETGVDYAWLQESHTIHSVFSLVCCSWTEDRSDILLPTARGTGLSTRIFLGTLGRTDASPQSVTWACRTESCTVVNTSGINVFGNSVFLNIPPEKQMTFILFCDMLQVDGTIMQTSQPTYSSV